MTGQVRLRKAREDDADVVADLEAACLGPDAWSPALVAEGVADAVPTLTYLVAETDEAPHDVVGYAAVSVAGDIAELQRIAVLSTHRRTGLARALLEHAANLAAGQGADRMLLEVRPTNSAAVALYAAAGFVEIDRRPRYYRDGSEAVVMRRGLRGACG